MCCPLVVKCLQVWLVISYSKKNYANIKKKGIIKPCVTLGLQHIIILNSSADCFFGQ